jgi:hypothetical protein
MVTTRFWLVSTTDGPVPIICVFQNAELIELDMKPSENTGVAAADSGRTSNPALKGARSKTMPTLRVREFRRELKESVLQVCQTSN